MKKSPQLAGLIGLALFAFSNCCLAAEPLHHLLPQDLEFLRRAGSVTVYGTSYQKDQTASTVIEGYPITASARLTTAEGRRIVIESLRQSIELGVSTALCFRPHHAVTASTKEGTTRTFVICIECCEAREFSGSSGGYVSYVISPSLQSVLDAILGAVDPSYISRSSFTGVCSTKDISSGENIDKSNSKRCVEWRDELNGHEVSAIDCSRHPRAIRFIGSGNLLREDDFKYED